VDVGDVNVQDLMNEVDSGATGNFKESLSGFQRIFGQFTSCPFCPSHRIKDKLEKCTLGCSDFDFFSHFEV
jgi:hypothetical protein